MKLVNTIAALAMTGTLALAGCSSANHSASSASTTSKTEDQSNSQSSSKEKPTTTNVKDGVSALLHDAKQLKKGIDANDESKIKENGPKLEESWKTFEDGVKSQYPDQYAQVEKYLDPIVAGSKASTIDKETLSKLNNQLIDVLYQLSQKLIPVDQVKAGVSKLLTTTGELKQAINAGDEAKIKEIGPKLEEIWKTFEDGVKPGYPDLYEQLEKSLNPEVAGSQVSPLDKQTLGKLNDELIQTLHALEQKAN
ncbi:hypothetical protein [Ectobacillus panaciterrae]|uniref:hypothetical protein n=1 Tax=Ectobacillus panaciterrae TaxID=363872 RepID=UPI000417561E|nr:hypothetical protein [Ectobacillus panaciterrae]